MLLFFQVKGFFFIDDSCIFAVQYLTDGIFETGAYAVPSKSQNSTALGQGGSSRVQSQEESY